MIRQWSVRGLVVFFRYAAAAHCRDRGAYSDDVTLEAPRRQGFRLRPGSRVDLRLNAADGP
jgi:hypothetical protein